METAEDRQYRISQVNYHVDGLLEIFGPQKQHLSKKAGIPSKSDLRKAKTEADHLFKSVKKLSSDFRENEEGSLADVKIEQIQLLCFITAKDLSVLSKVSKVWHLVEAISEPFVEVLPSCNKFNEYFAIEETTNEASVWSLSDDHLLSVCNLLEVRCIAPQWLKNHVEDFLGKIVAAKIKSFSMTSNHNAAFIASKLLMQACHLWSEEVTTWSEKQQENGHPDSSSDVEEMIIGLVRMTVGKSFPQETSLMSAVGLLTYLKTVSSESNLHQNIKSMMGYFLAGCMSGSHDTNLSIGGHTISISSMPDYSQSEFVFGTCCFCKAMLKCLEREVVLLKSQDGPCLLVEVLGTIRSLEDIKQGSEYQYALLMTSWLESWLQYINTQECDSIELIWSDLEYLVQLMWCEITRPVAGVQEQLVKAFQAFIRILQIGVEKEDRKAVQVYETLLLKVLAAPFHVKARYLILQSIIQYFGSESVISAHPSLPDELFLCMETNHLRSVAELVYKQCIDHLVSEGSKVSKEDFIAQWGMIWEQLLLKGLCSENSLTRNHVCNYFLFHTLRALPDCLPRLIASVKTTTGFSESRKLHAIIMILKQAKMKGILNSSATSQYQPYLSSGLQHFNDDIRSDSFSLLVQTSQTNQPFSSTDLKFFKDYVFVNLSSDNTAFRNQFVSDVKTALYRMRNSSSTWLRQLNPQNRTEGEYFNNSEVFGKLLEVATVIDGVFEKCLSNLFPGANYQRKRTCLDIISHIFHCFLKTVEEGKQMKGISEESKKKLLRWMQEHGKCQLLSSRSACLLISCLLESSNDLRSTASDLLVTFFPWPLPHCEAYPWSEPTEILCLGLKLISSPRVHDCEAGALLCKISFLKNVIEKKTHMRCIFPMKTFEEPVVVTRRAAKNSSPVYPPKHSSPAFHFLRSLLDSLKYQFTAMQKNTLVAAALTPMHGIIMALSECVVKIPVTFEELLKEDKEDAKKFLDDLLDCLQAICKFVLELLSGRTSGSSEKDEVVGMSPSFGEMTMAINDVVSSLSQVEMNDNGVGDAENSSTEHQLILSSSWLSLKQCSNLLGQISEQYCCNATLKFMMADSQHTAVASMLTDILLKCRHKGVIENCSLALSSLCSKFLTSHNLVLEKEVEVLLDRTLSLISTVEQKTSFTKKSAGLPMLVEAIVTAEPKQRERKLLKHALKVLTEIAKEPLPEELSDKHDLPQAHALNILQSLFRSSVTSEDVSPYISDVLKLTIYGFSSSCFVVRNSSMQLFGILIARLFGQKRVTDEHSLLNSLSIEEFFSRYPGMQEYLQAEVISAAEDQVSSTEGSTHLSVRPSLQPVLVILSKLGRGIQEQYDESLSEPFKESLERLLASPIYFVRRLVPRALLPFLAPSELGTLLEKIILELPQTSEEALCQNKLHGCLLFAQELIKQSSDSEKWLRNIQQTLPLSCSWIATEANQCTFTRAAFIDIITSVWQKISHGSENSDFTYFSERVIAEFLTQSPIYQLGGPQLCDSVTSLAFSLCQRKAISDSAVTLFVKFLQHPSPNLQLSTLRTIQSIVGEHIGVADLKILAESLLPSLQIVTIHSNLSESLRLWTCISSVAGKHMLDWDVPEWLNLQTLFVNLSEGKRGSLLCASGLPALSTLCYVDRQRCSSFDWFQWCDMIALYCQPDQSETLRSAVAVSLHIAAGKCFEALDENKVEEEAEHAVSLLQSIFKLLQDEQSEIRHDTAVFVNTLVGDAAVSSTECVQVNLAMQKMVLYFCTRFSWSISALNLLFEWLQGSPGEPVKAMKLQTKARYIICKYSAIHKGRNGCQVNLFEQMSANIYAEPVMEAEFLKEGIKLLASKMYVVSPEYVTSWLQTKYDLSSKELATVIDAMKFFKVADGSFFGVTGFSKPYQATYKLLQSFSVLKSVSAAIDATQLLNQQREKLTPLFEAIMEIHYIHPLLQEDSLLSSCLE
ncbi:Thyroid adenoma-associated protein-like [Holothuria leucospilota]|uniref:Thyroid adenoma-associated protein-like n=1 Tax=Holothuria leucospilota TaxID=206669 RepID=A0A9Q1CJG7_HOLLE|nr:Thyroid adenoma-associated protein-like [Holothuria leucospilota]